MMRPQEGWGLTLAACLVLACAPVLDAPHRTAGAEPAGGAGEPDGEASGAAPSEAGALLSETPRWTLRADTPGPEVCFGSSFALGDLDGDGRKDLVVALPSCSWAPPGAQTAGQVAIYRGEDATFSRQPVVAPLRWQGPRRRTSGRDLTVSVGDVDGDAFADLLVRSRSGVQLFAGRSDLAAMLSAPTFQVSGDGAFRGAHLSDVNGDGLDDVVSARAGRVSLFLATGGTGAPAFTLAGSHPGTDTARAGDTNGDGAEDVLIETTTDVTETRLHRGCPAGHPQPCTAGLSPGPAWTDHRTVQGLLPDLNGDGLSELLLGEGPGRSALHLSDGPTGGPAPTPVWTVLGDPLYPGFGGSAVPLGDVDGDGLRTEFAVTSEGRVYLFFPPAAVSSELRPAWAWSGRSDSLTARTPENSPLPVVPAGDLEGDGLDDVLVGLPPRQDTSFPEAGRVVLYGGGRLPSGVEGPPLLAPTRCGLAPAGPGGAPDLTVDGELLARSVFVERRDFAPDSCEVAEGCVAAPGVRRLLRFSVSIPNLGRGEAVIPGPDVSPELYEEDACHGHAHLLGFAGYELHGAQTGVVATGRKQGFNLLDMQPYCVDAPAPGERDPDMGISPGWADIYPADLPCQWLDITDVPDGTYSLRVTVDRNDLVDEQDVHPNSAAITVHLRGDSVEVAPQGP